MTPREQSLALAVGEVGSKPEFLWYELPRDLVAQRPREGLRSDSRLLVVSREDEVGPVPFRDARFSDVGEFLSRGDLLVLNNTRVLPWRFFARRRRDERPIELLLLGLTESGGGKKTWRALARPMRCLKVGDELTLRAGVTARVLGRNVEGNELVLEMDSGLEELRGVMPIPPYIRGGVGDEADEERYQTVYAEVDGSVAAPTAGLHFTRELLADLRESGIEQATVTLHLGETSFRPLYRDSGAPDLGSESYLVPLETVERIAETRAVGGKVIAVGTSTARALESWVEEEGVPTAWSEGKPRERGFSSTRLFIRPGFQFRVVDGLITNFHQPGSTHLLLVAALLGAEKTASAYKHALNHGYRFLSYGDAMLITPRRRSS